MEFKASVLSYAPYIAAWLLATAVAFLLAVATPSESLMLGHLPAFVA